jgi:hypothetical protein
VANVNVPPPSDIAPTSDVRRGGWGGACASGGGPPRLVASHAPLSKGRCHSGADCHMADLCRFFFCAVILILTCLRCRRCYSALEVLPCGK